MSLFIYFIYTRRTGGKNERLRIGNDINSRVTTNDAMIKTSRRSQVDTITLPRKVQAKEDVQIQIELHAETDNALNDR